MRSKRHPKWAILLCVSMCLQLLAPADSIFAAYTTPETETHNNASQKLGSYSTTGYWVTNPATGEQFRVPVHKEVETKGDKTLTTNSLDMEWLRENERELGINLNDFIQDGQYVFDAEIEYTVVTSTNPPESKPVHGKQDMLDVTDEWGGNWSSKTKKNILDEENSICEGTYYYPAPTTSPPTPVPVPTGVTEISPPPVVVTNTPIPTNKPTDVPITDAPAPTVEPPEPTVAPTEVPDPPEPEPRTYTYNNRFEYYKYYSTTNGHSISDITVNGTIADDTSASAISLAGAIASVGTRTEYAVGKDSKGNEWYLIPGTETMYISGIGDVLTATSVHPKTYNGHAVESSAVRYISELVYPDSVQVLVNNSYYKTYYVTSVGGSGPYYYSEPASAPTGTVSSNLGAIMGEYSWKQNAHTSSFTYLLGSVGSGTITSDGYGTSSYTDFDTYIYNKTFKVNYYVYNTTLTSVTLPAYCETVEDYAFHNCQALLIIKNIDNVVNIGTHSFSVAEVPELRRSSTYYSNPDRVTECIYSYDDSYITGNLSGFTSTMKKFQEYVTIPDYMEFPMFTTLATIGESAFENRSHLQKVELPGTVTTIYKNAFKNCLLDQIAVPNVRTEIKGNQNTLGTKGSDVNLKTMILTPVTSPAYPRAYGTKYDAYYRLMQEAYVYYYPNGGTPDTVQSELAEIRYIDASFGDQYFNIGNDNMMWLGEDGLIYSARVSGTTITGGLVTSLRSYKFETLEFWSKKNDYYSYYMGTTASGARYLIQVYSYSHSYNNTTTVTISIYCAWNPPSEAVYYEWESYGALRITGTDGRYHWLYGGTWFSEQEWPGEVASVVDLYQSHYNFTTESRIYSYFHSLVLCTDGTAYYKTTPTGEWYEVSHPSGKKWEAVGGNSSNSVAYLYVTTAYISSSNRYDRYRAYIQTNSLGTSAYANLEGSELYKDEVTVAGPFEVGSAGPAAATVELGQATIHHSQGTDYSSGTYVVITQDTASKDITMEIISNHHYDGEYDGSSSEYSLGTGELLAARVNSGTSYIAYYVSPAGKICRKSSKGNATVSDMVFKEIVCISSFLAPTTSWGTSSSTNCGQEGCGGHSSSGTIRWQDSDGYSVSPSVDVICLDDDGHLWRGTFTFNVSSGVITETLTRIDDRVYTDIAEYKTSYNNSDNSYSSTDPSGVTHSGSTSWSGTVSRFYALDENKDVYCYTHTTSSGVSSSGSTSSSTSHSSQTSGSTYYLPVEDFALTYMDYEDDVDKFAGYPFLLFTTGKPGLLTTTNAVIDIFCGVEVCYTVSGNKWFYAPDGKEFASWNTAADGTGTKRIPSGNPITKTIWTSNWQSAATDMFLYAQWQGATPLIEKTKVVYYDANGGYGTMGPTNIASGTNTFKVLANSFTKTGYTFAGYFTANADGTGTKYYPGQTYTMSKEWLILYAQWTPDTYTVKFAFDDFRVQPAWFFNSATITYDRSIAMPAEPQVKELVVDYDINTNSSMSTATSAKWETERPFSEEYTHSRAQFIGWDKYYYRNGEYINSWLRYDEFEEVSGLSTVKDDVVAMFPVWGGIDGYVMLPYATCPGYELYGWMDAPTYEDAADVVDYIPENGGGLYLPKANDTLYAWWEPCEYEITFVQDYNGKAPDTTGDTSVIMTFDTKCPDVTAPTLEHYVFQGYYTEPDGQGVRYYDRADRTTNVSSAYNDMLWQIYDGSVTTLYAHWVPDKAIRYEPNYTPVSPVNDGDSHTAWLEYIITGGNTWTLAANKFTRTGYTFKNWNTKADATGNSYNNKQTIDISWIEGTVPLYAQWTANKYNLTYDTKGNKPNASTTPLHITAPSSATYDEAFTVSNPTRVGYTFLGWNIGGMDNSIHVYDGNTTTATSLAKTLATIYKNLRCIAGTVAFVAQWEPDTYEVILNDRGATSTGHTEEVIMTFDKASPVITVPTKTGYTFHGYYTGIRGAGTKYYNADGTSAKTWTETDVYMLYAYWIQDPVVLPEEDDYVDPDVPPATDYEGDISREDRKGLLYADDYNDVTGAITDLQPYLTYDTPGSEGVIPGTELLSFRARMGAWMLSYKFHRNSGTDRVKIKVTVPYRTQYETEDEELVISDLQTETITITVPKAWSYWEVVESGMYYPDKVTLKNDAFKEDSITVPVETDGDSAVETPEYTAKRHGDYSQHVKWEEYDGDSPVLYIELEEEEYIISDVINTPPNVNRHLTIVCRNAARKDDRQAEVRSDRYEFDGEVLLSDEWQTQHGAELDETKLPAGAEDIELTSYEQTYKSGIGMDELKANGKYETTAVITYQGDEDNIGTPAAKDVPLLDINDLNIHTPVACDGVAVNGIELEEDKNILTLKEALNFFTLRIDNYGTHRMSLGYGTKDFRYALSGKSNVAEKDGSLLNQVKFPFDVYVDVRSNSKIAEDTYNTTGDCYFKAETWLTLGAEAQQFYVPVTSKNGLYQVEFRSIAVNCPLDETGQYRLSDVAQLDSNRNVDCYVATDVLELEIKSYLKDFRITETNDMAAEKQRKNGCQALTLKKGYGFSYEVITQGEFYGDTVEIEVTPTYYWESLDETIRQEVKIYRLEELLSGKLRECYAWENEPILINHENYDVIVQSFTGKGHLPEDILCVAIEEANTFEEYIKRQTITGKETFFKQDGYLIIHFEIRVRSNNGTWYRFLCWNETELAEDALAAGWNYIAGDVIRYDLSKSIKEDYEVGGVE